MHYLNIYSNERYIKESVFWHFINKFKTIPAIKENVETVNFNQYWSNKEQKIYLGN